MGGARWGRDRSTRLPEATVDAATRAMRTAGVGEVSARQLLLEQGKDLGDHALAEDRMVQFLRDVSDLHEVVLGAN
jgi:hypothetical protein